MATPFAAAARAVLEADEAETQAITAAMTIERILLPLVLPMRRRAPPVV